VEKPLGKPVHRLEDNTKMGFKEKTVITKHG